MATEEKVRFWKIFWRIVLVAILLIVVVALFTVPDSDKHKDALVPLYEQVMSDATADDALQQQLEDSIMAVASKGVNEGVNEGISDALDRYLSDPAVIIALATSSSQRSEVFEKVKQDVLNKVIEKTRDELKEYLSHDTSSKLRTIAYGALSKGLQTTLTEAVINNRLETTNYYLFSVGSVESGNESYWLSFGILGHVFTYDKSKLRKVLLGQ